MNGTVRNLDLEGSDNHLIGAGTISSLSLFSTSGATYIAPGPGIAKLTLTNLSTQGAGPVELQFDLKGTTAGISYDQLVLLGSSDLSTVSFDLNVGYQPQVGDVLELIDYQRNGTLLPAVGTPEGTILTADGYQFRLSYRGGTGNDVTVTVVPEPSLAALVMGPVFMSLRRRAV